ncbi:MAG: hypothetical protein A3I29_03960 [Candidatus Magasanikbacteria bacterium RIFCSPLOWO2_02_FULL_44_11]|uniref:SIS domain-containing protein n=2 Tax=Candidatus Magasanikiibacteriota TaxID=1752731 RepID=A0A1F6N9H3_9BACT|nr:MAG: hypothetical protein A3D53_02090 [Candidatus Magasanikbacteria bacterium RIFCSPHIGHO2_02_FULL_45_10]OGH80572.1 MAG: hypothetical protein A3I29_03960 [Candidatus Magasanikbacteria bacterium RIFCSPLOWO2_02_FULL_44_11]
MTISLDNRRDIEQLDSKKMLRSLELLGEQVREVLGQAKKVVIPKNYQACDTIVVLGMGGSTLGSHIIKSIFDKELSQPLEIVNGYHLPAYTNKKTLVVASSYSGNTEEVLSALKEAQKKKCKIMIITSGGELAAKAVKYKLPALIFTTKNNPCGSPRMGLGYSILGQMILLSRAGVIKLTPKTIKEILATLDTFIARFGVATPLAENPAKQLATQLDKRLVWYIGAEHLSGTAHTMANQLNENAKRFGRYFLIPELNHHLMEGLAHPQKNPEILSFVFLESSLYDPRVSKRFTITKDIVTKNKIPFTSYQAQSKTKLLQAVEVLVFGSYVSFYQAISGGLDPTAIPFVDYFKAALKA